MYEVQAHSFSEQPLEYNQDQTQLLNQVGYDLSNQAGELQKYHLPRFHLSFRRESR